MINRKYHIVRGSYFEVAIAQLLNGLEEKEQVKKSLEEGLYARKYPIKQTGNTYRTINHWMSKGLIDDLRKTEQGWRKFNLHELIWIKIIERLRRFDLSIDKIREVKKHIINNDNAKTIFEFFYIEARIQKKEIKLVVFENGEADLVSKIELPETLILFPDLEYLSLSFTSILEEVTNKKIQRSDPLELAVSNKEKYLLETIHSGEYNNIELKTEGKFIKKFKSKNIEKEIITNIKEVNIKELTKRKNSKIIIHTNNDQNITSIEIETSV